MLLSLFLARCKQGCKFGSCNVPNECICDAFSHGELCDACNEGYTGDDCRTREISLDFIIIDSQPSAPRHASSEHAKLLVDATVLRVTLVLTVKLVTNLPAPVLYLSATLCVDDFLGGSWALVRHAAAGSTWHRATYVFC